MTSHSTFANFIARLREFIRRATPPSGRETPDTALTRPDPPPPTGQRLSISNDANPTFNSLALELFALQFAHVEPYRRFCLARKTAPETASDWTGIPAIPVAAFKELELTSLSPAERIAEFHSSGTTAHQPSRHLHSAQSLDLYEASLWPWFHTHLLGDGAGEDSATRQRGAEAASSRLRLCSLSPCPARAPHSSLVHMFEIVRRHLAAPESAFAGGVTADGAWALDFQSARRALQQAEDTQTRLLILGTAFSFVHLIDHLAATSKRFRLAPGSRVMETGGYKGRSRAMPKPELHALVAQYLGVPEANIICEYGMSELSSQAYDTVIGPASSGIHAPDGGKRCFRFPPWARVQILSPETGQEVGEGETGLIRICDLANVRSVMAIQTEDLGIRRGHGFELIGRAVEAEPRGCSLMESRPSR